MLIQDVKTDKDYKNWQSEYRNKRTASNKSLDQVISEIGQTMKDIRDSNLIG